MNLISSENRKQINTINSELNEALQFEIRNRFKSSPKQDGLQQLSFDSNHATEEQNVNALFDKINTLVSQLHLIGYMHNQHLQYFKYHKYKMKLPYLLSEIYEIENAQNMAPLTPPLLSTPNHQTHQFINQNGQQQQQHQQQTFVKSSFSDDLNVNLLKHHHQQQQQQQLNQNKPHGATNFIRFASSIN